MRSSTPPPSPTKKVFSTGGYYWSSTTHGDWQGHGSAAAYVPFGRGLGYDTNFFVWIDVHGAGCQRSDPKTGDPADYPTGHGPQGDAIRIYNFMRPVRDIEEMNDLDDDGLPDWWETLYYGDSTNANPSSICSNGVNTVSEAYIAGLDPTDPASAVRVEFSDLWNEIEWNSASGRVYAVYWTTNLNEGFQPLETNIHWSVGGYTDTLHNAETTGFYKIDVRLEQVE